MFNHPSEQKHPLKALRTFEDLRYVAEADPRMIGLEIFNRSHDYSACFVRALHEGWHLGAIGAADNHGGWGRPDRALTALIVDVGRFGGLTRAAVRNTLKARRFYATFDHNLHHTYTADGNWMGSRLQREAGQPVTLLVQTEDESGDRIRRIEIYGSDIPKPTCTRRSLPPYTRCNSLPDRYRAGFTPLTDNVGHTAIVPDRPWYQKV